MVTLLLALTIATNAHSQSSQYYSPEGKDFVVVGGCNMFSKSLSSNASDYCIKTSDIPVFKLSSHGEEKTLSFTITMNGKTFALVKAAHCEARYSEGARRYILSDAASWGRDASVEIIVCPLTQRNGAIMKFTCNGVAFDTELSATIEGRPTKSWFAHNESYFEVDGFDYSNHTTPEMARTFTIAQRWNKAATERIEISTPDPYLNNVIGPLLSASRGGWEKYKWIDGYDYDAKVCAPIDDNDSEASREMKLSLAEYMAGSPNRAFDILRSTVVRQMYQSDSPASMPQDAIGEAMRAVVQGLFGVQPDSRNSRCIIRPGMPREWKEASIRTPYIIYKYHRVGGKDIYEVTQCFSQPHDIIIRQNTGNGGYRDIVGSSKKHQIISVATLNHDIEDAPPIVVEQAHKADTLPSGAHCRNVKIGKGKKTPTASTAEGCDVGFDIKVKGKYSCAYLLVTGKFIANKESGQVVATYSDGSQEVLSISNPKADNEGRYLLKMPLDPSKKLKTISIIALADGAEIRLERLVLSDE